MRERGSDLLLLVEPDVRISRIRLSYSLSMHRYREKLRTVGQVQVRRSPERRSPLSRRAYTVVGSGSRGTNTRFALHPSLHRREVSMTPVVLPFGQDFAGPVVERLAQSAHPFVDGNKRTGIVAALVFLAINDMEVIINEDDLEKEVWATAKGESTKERLAEFFRKHKAK